MSQDEPPDWEAMEAIEPSAGEELERVMARYARVRLDPSPAEARRARAAVMEHAWRARLESLPAAPARRRTPFAHWSPRRLATTGAAAVLAGLLVGSSAFAASRAGGPLYGVRLAVEDATLPADPSARLQAEIANAQARLAEAYDAEVRGDQGALTAALSAYGEDATTLAAATGPSAEQALAALQQHQDVLQSLIGRAPASALPGLDRALLSSDSAIQRLTATERGQNSGGGGNGSSGNGNGNAGGAGAGPAGSGNPGGGNGNAGGAGAGPAASGNPGGGNAGGSGSGAGGRATPAPTATPAATVAPERSPKPHPSPKP